MRLFLQKLKRRHCDGPGGISALLPIAIPMIVSSVFDTLMTFIDRLFMAHVGKEHIAACMSGGITSWLCLTLFAGLIGYSSTLVAHHYGAKRYEECPKVVFQGIILAFVSYPLALAASYFAAMSFEWAGHDPIQIELERRYFWYMAFGGILALLRSAFAAFFAGIGKTKVIMRANAAAVVVNIIANYVLIFGKFGFPALGIDGAAIGTLLSSTCMTGIIGASFWRHARQKPFRTKRFAHLDPYNLKTLLRFGAPNGLENLLGMASFVAINSAMHSYGADAAAAITIVFSWDLVMFFPLIGLQVGVSTLVGQNLGAGDIPAAERSAYSGFKLTFWYSALGVFFFCAFPHLLVGVFTPDIPGVDYQAARDLAIPMLRIASLYLMFDGVMLIASGALRGAGDTLAVMLITVNLHWISAALALAGAYYFNWPPTTAWIALVISFMLGSIVLCIRFKQGKWKQIRMLEPAA
ncbi:MAG: MATE family efflux transporter [Lentisphaerae bacterium]|jgi:MATE family multidrug resistance protein|nr:MATE family efflux transporter [Lentisphaerota bacterium]